MLTVSQIFLLLVGCHSITADVSADDGGAPMLTGDFLNVGLRYEQSRFIPLSIHPPEKLVHHNGSRERTQGYCYGMSSWGSRFYISISLANSSKIEEPGYSCNGAVCCDNGSCAGSGQICCGRGICDAGYGCCEDIGCVSNSDTCCANGGSCPGGQGCFRDDNTNQIFCSPTGGRSEPATSTVTPESTISSVNEPTSATSGATTAVLALSSVYYYTYEL